MSKIKVPAYKFDENTTDEEIDYFFECIGKENEEELLKQFEDFVEIEDEILQQMEELTEGVDISEEFNKILIEMFESEPIVFTSEMSKEEREEKFNKLFGEKYD